MDIVDITVTVHDLDEIDVLTELGAEERRWLAARAPRVTYKRGQMIYEPDDRGEAVFLLQHGRVERYHVARDGRRLVVETLRAPAMFGELGLVVTGRYGCYAAAAEDCLLRVVQSLDVRALVQRNPGLGLRLLAHLGRHCHSCEAELAKLTFQGLAARLAALLLREADEAGAVTAHSHQELAERLGT